MTPTKYRDDHSCSRGVSNSCSTSGTRQVTQDANYTGVFQSWLCLFRILFVTYYSCYHCGNQTTGLYNFRILFSYSKIIQSEHLIYFTQCSDWLFVESQYKIPTQNAFATVVKTQISNLMRTMRFWNNLHQSNHLNVFGIKN